VTSRGFTVLELLVACALLVGLTGGVAALSMPLRDGFERSLASADLTGGGRVALERLAADARQAGSGAEVGAAPVHLANVLQTLEAFLDLDTPVAASRGRAVRMIRVPLGAPQGTLRVDAAAGTTLVEMETASLCTATGPACGFQPDTPAVLHDQLGAALVTVETASDPGVVRLRSPLDTAFGAGAVLAAVEVTTYGVRRDTDGSMRLVRVTEVEQPVLQNVVDFEVILGSEASVPVRHVEFRLRVEAPSASLRGPPGVLFRRGGTARRQSLWVPDVELRSVVAVRSRPR
jgi:Tfp pilus assembly protein PilW